LLRFRLLSALFATALALVFVALDAWLPIGDIKGVWMLPLGGYLFFGSAVECVSMMRGTPYHAASTPALLGCGGVMIAAAVPVLWPFLTREPYPADSLLGTLGWPLAAILIAQIGSFAWLLPTYAPHSHFFARSVLAGWIAAYFGGCFAFAIGLRLIGSSDWGLFVLVGMIVVTKFSDAGAYFAGRAFGSRKLAAVISPGKTVEGLIGGIVVASLVAWVYFSLGGPLFFGKDNVSVGGVGVVLLGVLATLAGVTGDLLESIFKREMDCKDSGRMLPGLGGLWDVTDSLLPALVIGYLVMASRLISGPSS
jgi:phosphatidate cytidylyltransferase